MAEKNAEKQLGSGVDRQVVLGLYETLLAGCRTPKDFEIVGKAIGKLEASSPSHVVTRVPVQEE